MVEGNHGKMEGIYILLMRVGCHIESRLMELYCCSCLRLMIADAIMSWVWMRRMMSMCVWYDEWE